MPIVKKPKEEQEKIKYYSLKRILKENCLYNVIYGERSNGKTYSVHDYGIQDYWNSKGMHQMALIRRMEEDFTGKRGEATFEGITKSGRVAEITGGVWDRVVYYASRWYLAKWDSNLNKVIRDHQPFCYGFCLSTGEHDKSSNYDGVKTILFDEFLTRKRYLPNEFVEFMNVLSTIIRQRDDVKIFMLGNTVNMFSPYFAEMGISNVGKQKKGTIDVYTYGDSELRVAVEYSDSPTKKKSDKYFAFNNPKLAMITSGEWELALYPHLPFKYTEKDVKFKYYIEFAGLMLQCNLILHNGCVYTYVHRKTTRFKYPDKDIIFSQAYSARPNWFRRINRPTHNIVRRLYSYFVQEKVFYQDNEVGEVMRNYLQWCSTDRGFE